MEPGGGDHADRTLAAATAAAAVPVRATILAVADLARIAGSAIAGRIARDEAATVETADPAAAARGVEPLCALSYQHRLAARGPRGQYDFGSDSTFSAMKLRIISRLTGAIRGIRLSRRNRSTWYSFA